MSFLHYFPSKCVNTNPTYVQTGNDDLDFTVFIGSHVLQIYFVLPERFSSFYFVTSLNSLVHIYGCKIFKLPFVFI